MDGENNGNPLLEMDLGVAPFKENTHISVVILVIHVRVYDLY